MVILMIELIENCNYLIAKVPRILGAGQSTKFSADYLDNRSRSQKCFIFPRREACLIAMSYSYELQALVFDRMTALERARTTPSNACLSRLRRAR